MTNPNYVGAAETTLHTIEDHLRIHLSSKPYGTWSKTTFATLGDHHPTGRDRMIVKPDLSSQAE